MQHCRCAVGGKTGKTSVLPRFCKIEGGSGAACSYLGCPLSIYQLGKSRRNFGGFTRRSEIAIFGKWNSQNQLEIDGGWNNQEKVHDNFGHVEERAIDFWKSNRRPWGSTSKTRRGNRKAKSKSFGSHLTGFHLEVIWESFESSVSQMGVIWERCGSHLGGIWEAYLVIRESSGSNLEVIRKSYGSHLRVKWELSGSHHGVIWESSGSHLEAAW